MSHIHQKRKKIRIPDYDYSWPGAYFITVCTHNNECLFGEIINDKAQLNQYGRIVVEEWLKTKQVREFVELDTYIVMPDHFHGIIVIKDTGTARRAPTTERFGRPVEGSISTMVRSFKSAVTKHINILRCTPDKAVWQRGFYDHVIRHNEEINLVREYILNNPLRSALESKNPYISKQDFNKIFL